MVIVYMCENPSDLTNPKMFRDLTKPIGALTEKRLGYFKVWTDYISNKKKKLEFSTRIGTIVDY